MEPVILFTSPPNFEELCGVTVLVKPSVQPQLVSLQPHITKCREIIFTEPDVIASPSCDLDACFNIVMQQSLFKSGRVQARLQKLGCQLSKPYRVLPSLYQACLHYTMLARLAPVWNKAGDWLLQGRDFLMHTGYTNAIKMRLCVNKDEMFVSVCGTVVRFPPLQVEDLCLSQQEMLQIVKSTEDGVSEVMLADCWCHVLPSMKRGRIISVSLNISRQSPFTCYRDLQRYWKNMYGYRLPDTDEDILYCQVCFLPSGGGKHFTYPNVCLRAGPMQMVQRVDPKPILTTFLQDVHGRVGAVCGSPLRFQPKISFACPSLHVAGEETRRVSLSAKPVSKPVAPVRSQQSISHLFNITNTDRQASLKEKLYKQTNEMAKEDMGLVNATQAEIRLIHENEKQVQEYHDKDDSNSYTVRQLINIDKKAPAREKLYEQKTEKPKEDMNFVNVSQTEKGQENEKRVQENHAKEETERRLTQENEKQVQECQDNDDLNLYTVGKKAENQIITQKNGTENTIYHSQPNTSVDQKYNSLLQKQMTNSDNSGKHNNTQPVVANKFVPHFRPKPKCHVDKKQFTSENFHCIIPKETSFKPVFKPCLSKATSSKKDKTVAQSSGTNIAIIQSPSSKLRLATNKTSNTPAKEQDSPQLTFSVSVPHFRNNLKQKSLKCAQTKPALSKTVSSSVIDLKTVAEKTKQCNPRSMMKSTTNSDLSLSAQRPDTILLPPVSSVSNTPIALFDSISKIASERKSQPSPRSIMNSPSFCGLVLPAERLENMLLTPAHGNAREPPSTPVLLGKSSQESNGWCKNGSQDAMKRKKVTEGEETLKKPRVKSQVQNLDVEALARSNQLGKVNTVTLTAWLKDRGVICRSKDKKNDLVDKVNSYISDGKPAA
ncbi:unnamed protein product [Candidula unifasciata]|uniref:DUF4708 domain-containing protein n=1 Tax=Candidula unifasciata TaxID=100452 RepID=A0A8S3YWY5_9EUPU|nr:unnamed protein product [Candidula unifasciata]